MREVIRAADAVAFAECMSIHTISRVVSGRLRRFNGVESEPLHHPPPGAERLRPGPYGDAILFPGRVNESKRQHLAIEALALAREPVRLCFIGADDAPGYAAAVRAGAASSGWMGGWSGAAG